MRKFLLSAERKTKVLFAQGITFDSVPKLFDPFYSTKRPGRGVGMGLSVAMAIVKSCEGKIEFAPAPGGGAAFTITLPVGRGASAHATN